MKLKVDLSNEYKTSNLQVRVQYGAMPYKMRSHEDDEEDGVADDAGQRDHIVGAAVEDAVDDVIHVVLVVCHQYRQLSWCDHPIV